jgi:hypothetical protein
MKTAYLALAAAVAATVSISAGAVTGSTDEARAEAGARIAAAEHAASLRPFQPRDSETVVVSDTDSARQAAGQASARLAHDSYLAGVLRAGAGIKPVAINVSDTDSARAAAGQKVHQDALVADYADYQKVQSQAAIESSAASN